MTFIKFLWTQHWNPLYTQKAFPCNFFHLNLFFYDSQQLLYHWPLSKVYNNFWTSSGREWYFIRYYLVLVRIALRKYRFLLPMNFQVNSIKNPAREWTTFIFLYVRIVLRKYTKVFACFKFPDTVDKKFWTWADHSSILVCTHCFA